MTNYGKLSDCAEAEIDQLRADGINLTPAEIVELNALGWDVEDIPSRRELSRGIPVECRGVWLWPPSLYAQEWFSRVGGNMPTQRLQEWALAYSMAHGRDEGEPLALDGVRAIAAVTKFGFGLRATHRELINAIHDVIRQDETPDMPPVEGTGMGVGEFSAYIASMCGGDVDFWERRCAAGYVHTVLQTITAQAASRGECKAIEPKTRAVAALGWAVEKIRQSRKVADNG